eukprot:SAG31_NODE_4307_length_3369_cov_2.579205_2_plen_382_part_00
MALADNEKTDAPIQSALIGMHGSQVENLVPELQKSSRARQRPSKRRVATGSTTASSDQMRPVGMGVGYEDRTGWLPERLQRNGDAIHPAGHKNQLRWPQPQLHPALGPPPPATPSEDKTLLTRLQPAGADVFTDAFVSQLEAVRKLLLTTLSAAMEPAAAAAQIAAQESSRHDAPLDALVAELDSAASCTIPGYEGSTAVGQLRWRRSANQPSATRANFGPAASVASVSQSAPYREGPPPADDSVVMQHYSARYDFCSELLARESMRRSKFALSQKAAVTPPVSPPEDANGRMNATHSLSWWQKGYDLQTASKMAGVDPSQPLFKKRVQNLLVRIRAAVSKGGTWNCSNAAPLLAVQGALVANGAHAGNAYLELEKFIAPK